MDKIDFSITWPEGNVNPLLTVDGHLFYFKTQNKKDGQCVWFCHLTKSPKCHGFIRTTSKNNGDAKLILPPWKNKEKPAPWHHECGFTLKITEAEEPTLNIDHCVGKMENSDSTKTNNAPSSTITDFLSSITSAINFAFNQSSKPGDEQQQLTEEQIKQQQRDQDEYASRFLAAVQERVAQPRPSSASAASQQQSQLNGVANNGHGTSLQNLAATLQQEGLNGGGYFDQDINTYDFKAQHQAQPPFQLSQELLDRIASLPNKMILYEVQIGLEQLLVEPSEFDAWIVAIRDRLAQKDVTTDDLEAAAWLVIEMGIYGDNAQYNFAKVCTYLYERLSSFKEPLLLQVKEFHNYHNQYPLDIFQNLLVFNAELYVQAFAPVGVRNHPIPTILYEEFIDILNAEPMTDTLIKKIVQTLKLCGRHLETDIGDQSMGELFKKLDDFTKEEQRPKTLTDTGASFITNLMLYRSSGWGGSGNDSSTTSATSAPIRFAPDNNMDLTEEEIRFLESNGAMEGGSSFSSGVSSNDIYDAEILEDYEKFLRDHAERTAISAAEKSNNLEYSTMQQRQQQPPQSQSQYRAGPPTNVFGYSQQSQQQQQVRRNHGIPDTVTSHYTSQQQQQQSQRIPPPSHHQQLQQQQQHQSQQQGVQDPISGLRMSLAEQKQLTDEQPPVQFNFYGNFDNRKQSFKWKGTEIGGDQNIN